MQTFDAEIVTIGDELNRGEIVDTNSSWLAERLTELGAYVRFRTSVTDDPADLAAALRQAAARATWVVCSGGLGPTDDDRTVDVVAGLTGKEPVRDPAHESKMATRYAELGFRITPNNLRQVRVPGGAEVLENRKGAAPGFQVRLGQASLFFMPGVPREMKAIFDDEIRPRLAALIGDGVKTAKRTWRVTGMGESHVDHALAGLIEGLAGATLHFRIAYPETLVTVVARRDDEAEARAVLDRLDGEVRSRLGDHCYGTGDEGLAQVVGRLLSEREATLAVAESCTGGMLGQLVTAVAGSSRYFRGGIISYDNEIKERLLGVRKETLAAHGAVSPETVIEMAEGARRALGATHALAISGIAGPGGGTPQKPVGTVELALACADRPTETRHLQWSGTREQVRTVAAFAALHLLYKSLTR
ncbi:MAG: competence/damage-inducible protein A [Polyangia bacterium]